MTTLSGKTAVVTGASRGIGRASALALAGRGAQVLVHYSSGMKEAEAVVAEIRQAGGRADTVAADLSEPDGAHKLAKQVRAVVGDRLDILVANAGLSRSASIEDTTVEDFDRLFAVNVRAPFFLVQQLLPIMCRDSSIVLVSSLAAHAAVGTLSAYAATKVRSTPGEAFRRRAWRAWYPRQRRGARCRCDRHVELRQDGRRAGLRARHPGSEASRPA